MSEGMAELRDLISDLEKSLENARSERDRISAAYTDVIRERSTYLKVTKERDSALADNAALIVRLRGARAALTQNATFPTDVMCAVDILTDKPGEPHPGAALLDEHRKALDEERVRWTSEMKAQHAEWRKALVRARNYSLNRVYERLGHRFADNPTALDLLASLMNEVSAMKEPEPTEPA